MKTYIRYCLMKYKDGKSTLFVNRSYYDNGVRLYCSPFMRNIPVNLIEYIKKHGTIKTGIVYDEITMDV